MVLKQCFAFFAVLLFIVTTSCKNDGVTQKEAEKNIIVQNDHLSLKYATGFTITPYETYTLLTVNEAFPNAKKNFTYALVSDKDTTVDFTEQLEVGEIDEVIKVPLKSVVVTSTTHIPSLEMLGVTQTLVGFPGLDYISSSLSRKRINNNLIKELGQNESLNTELTIDLAPDAVVTFGVEGENKTLNTLQKAAIPVLYNGDWVEKHPLGKAEWIKFFGALYGKERLADSLFANIESQYLATQKLVSKISKRPTILSGAMYKDVWYVPKGDSWQAKIIEDAGGNYLWSETAGTGSIALSIESVLEKGQNADFWIAPAQYTSYTRLLEDSKVYGEFDAFKNRKTYTFAKQKGETGGLLYYEIAPNRPDLVLADLVSILHPELLKTSPTFFTPLDE